MTDEMTLTDALNSFRNSAANVERKKYTNTGNKILNRFLSNWICNQIYLLQTCENTYVPKKKYKL